MTWKQALRARLALASHLPRCAMSRILLRTRYAPRFSGNFPDRAAAVKAQGRAPSYDSTAAAQVSFEVMCKRTTWDYPVIFWLSQLLPRAPAVLDAGGHWGTKYIAFEPLINMDNVNWTVYDLPATVRLARARQSEGHLPQALRFIDTIEEAETVDILLASGLLQYLDVELIKFLSSLKKRPPFIILNKVALCEGPTRFTLERIGAARVPYQIRNRATFEAEINSMGYQILDQWAIPDLAHLIPTHPWMGVNQSCGYILKDTKSK